VFEKKKNTDLKMRKLHLWKVGEEIPTSKTICNLVISLAMISCFDDELFFISLFIAGSSSGWDNRMSMSSNCLILKNLTPQVG